MVSCYFSSRRGTLSYVNHVCESCLRRSVLTNREYPTDGPEVSKDIVRPYDMATTIEALIAAVDMDGADQHQIRKVCTRFGIEHKRLEPMGRLWVWEIVRSKLDLPEKFFIGHHLKLQEGVFETQLNRSPARKKQEIWPWCRARRLWRLTRQLWQPPKEPETKPSSRKKPKRLASRPTTHPPLKAVPAAKGSQSTVRITTPPVDEPINKAELPVEDSVAHQEDNEKATAPEAMTDTPNLAERHGVAESSTTKAFASSKRTKKQPQPVLAAGISVNNTEPTETGSQDSNTASNYGAEPTPSGAATTGTEKNVERAHEASETESAERTTGDDPTAQLKEKAGEMWEMVKMLDSEILKIKEAGDEMTEKDKIQTKALRKQRQRIVDRRSLIISKLRRRQKGS